MKKTAFALSMALILGTSSAIADASKQDASNAIQDAISANNKAAEKGFEWRDTYKKLLGPAKKAYQDGQYEKAISLANTAKSHALLGLSQAEQSANPNTL